MSTGLREVEDGSLFPKEAADIQLKSEFGAGRRWWRGGCFGGGFSGGRGGDVGGSELNHMRASLGDDSLPGPKGGAGDRAAMGWMQQDLR